MSDLTIIEQKQVDFLDSQVTAVLVQDADGRENIYIPLKPLVEGMGLSWNGQRERIKRNPILADVCRSARVTRAEQDRTRSFNMLSIPISHLNGFLFGIHADRVKDEIRPLIIEYQEKCYQVLFSAFNSISSMTRFYRAIGHDDGWIEKRLTKHTAGTALNDVWLKNGVPIEHHDQLHDIINSGAFGLTIDEHKQFKNLPEGENLHDNMTLVELLVSGFGDESTRQFIENENPSNLEEHELLARAGGDFAGDVRKLYEERTGKPVLSSKNHLEKKKRPLLGNDESE